jgi:flagellar basal-body rod protein FlgB
MECFLFGMIEGLYQTEPRQIAAALLDRGMLKHQAFASNIANVETPGYKRVDLNPRFEGKLNEILNSGDLSQLKSFSHGLVEDTKSAAVRPDGNNVKIESELLAMNRNAMEYEFLSKYMAKSLGRMRMAITGSVSTQM